MWACGSRVWVPGRRAAPALPAVTGDIIVDAGCHIAIAAARGPATPAQLRQGGAAAVVADLQELLGPTS